MSPDLFATACAQILTDIDDFTARVVATIRGSRRGFEHVPYDEHYADSHRNLRQTLVDLPTGGRPGRSTLDYARAMARNRASAGLSLSDAIEGYHIAFRELWAEILRRTADSTAAERVCLVDGVERIWAWFQEVSAAFSEAYTDAVKSLALSRAEALRLLLVPAEGATPRERQSLARDAGFDPDGTFQVIAVRRRTLGDVERLNQALNRGGCTAHAVSIESSTVVIAQGADAGEIRALIRACGIDGTVAIGLPRPGVRGVVDSYIDARQLLRIPRSRAGFRTFDEDWPTAMLYDGRERVTGLLVHGKQVAIDFPYLAEAVRAFADNGYSISAAARSLAVHANTARYRIERWRQLTGWDLFTINGLLRSLAALELLRGDRSGP